jgi:transcriptional regulator with XRE-family HTH domain
MTTSGTTPEADSVLAALAVEIKISMLRAEMTQSELASKSGLTTSGLSRRLRGERRWLVSELWRVAQALDESASELIHRAEVAVMATDTGAAS